MSVCYIVDGIDAAIAFYCRHVGFREDMRTPQGRAGGLKRRQARA